MELLCVASTVISIMELVGTLIGEFTRVVVNSDRGPGLLQIIIVGKNVGIERPYKNCTLDCRKSVIFNRD